MEMYQKDNQWYARTEGGHVNRDRIPAEERAIPGTLEPIATWEERRDSSNGEAVTRSTLFAHDGVPVLTLRVGEWYGSWGNSWSEHHETFADPLTPPVYGPSLRWTGSGWEEASLVAGGAR